MRRVAVESREIAQTRSVAVCERLLTSTTEHSRLAWQLLRAADWFDMQLRAELVERDFPQLNRTDARTFAALAPGASTPADLAREVGITRQSMQQLLARLESHGIIRFVPHPTDRRRVAVHFDVRGEEMRVEVQTILRGLERKLLRRLGAEHFQTLKAALDDPVWTEDLVRSDHRSS